MDQVIFLCKRAFNNVVCVLIMGDLGWSLGLRSLLKRHNKGGVLNLHTDGKECKDVTQASFGGPIRGGSHTPSH